MKKKQKSGRIGNLGGLPIEQLAGVFAGAVSAKVLNGVSKSVPMLAKNRFVLPVIKLAGGYFLNRSSNDFLKNAGLGMMGEGAMNMLEAGAPQVFKQLAPPMDGGVGSTTVLNLEEYSGMGYINEVDAMVAGGEAFSSAEEDYAVMGY